MPDKTTNDPETRAMMNSAIFGSVLCGFFLTLFLEFTVLGFRGLKDVSLEFLLGLPVIVAVGAWVAVLVLQWFGGDRALAVVGWTLSYAMGGLIVSLGLGNMLQFWDLPWVVFLGVMVVAGHVGFVLGMISTRPGKRDLPEL